MADAGHGRVAALLHEARSLADEIEGYARRVEQEGEDEDEQGLPGAVGMLRTVADGISEAAGAAGLTRAEAVEALRIALRVWNICVGAVNAGIAVDDSYAELRLIAADVLSAGGDVEGLDRLQAAHRRCYFYLKTAGEFSSLGHHEAAESCLSKGIKFSEVLEHAAAAAASARGGGEEEGGGEDDRLLVDMLFSLQIQRAETSSCLDQKALCMSSLSKARHMLPRFEREEGQHACLKLAQLNMRIGKSLFKSEEHVAESIPLLQVAYELSTRADEDDAPTDPQLASKFKRLGSTTIEYLAAAHIKLGQHAQAIKCLETLEPAGGGGSAPKASMLYLHINALLGVSSTEEAEAKVQELIGLKDCTPEMAFDAIKRLVLAEGAREGPCLARFFQFLERGWGKGEVAPTVPAVQAVPGCVSWLLQAAMTRFEDGPAAAEAVLGNEVVVKALEGKDGDEERSSIHANLWNAACEHFDTRAYEAANRLFIAVLQVCDAANRGKTLRMQAVCQLGIKDLDRAIEYIEASKEFEPDCVMGEFLLAKVLMEKGDYEAAAAQVKLLAKCGDFQPSYLRVLCQEALAAGEAAGGVAGEALMQLFDVLCAEGGDACAEDTPDPATALLEHLKDDSN